jgi:hypothetical protein
MQNLLAMEIALRVLTALCQKRLPSPVDLNELERFVGKKPIGVPLDDWLCELITQAMQQRATAHPTIEFVSDAA